jgi:hypothetical protein
MEDIEKALWDDMLTSEMNARYYEYLSRRYAKHSKSLIMFVAIASTGAIASLQIWKAQLAWFHWSWVWDGVSIIAVCAAVIAPFLDFGTNSKKAFILAQTFTDHKNRYESLWLRRKELNPPALRQEFQLLREQLTRYPPDDSDFPRDRSLLTRCQAEVIKYRGL